MLEEARGEAERHLEIRPFLRDILVELSTWRCSAWR